MEHKKDIGKALRDRLDELDKKPADHIWASIEADLDKKKRRRLFPFWFFLTSVVLVSLVYFGTDVFDSEKPGRQNVSIEQIGNGATNGNGNGNGSNASGNAHAAADGENGNSISSDGNSTDANTIGSDGNASGKNPIVSSDGKSSGNESANENGNGFHKKSGKTGISSDAENSSGNGNKTAKNKWSKNNKQYVGYQNKGKSKNRKIGKNGKLSGVTENPLASGDENASGKNSGNDVGNKTNPDGNSSIKTDSDLSKLSGESEKAIASKDSIPKPIDKKEKPKEKPRDSTKTEEYEVADSKTFSIFLYVAPTFYNRISKISTVDRRLDSISGRAEITYNYGGFLCFEYDEKWSLRFGVAKTKLQFVTKGIAVSSLNNQNYYNVDYAGGYTNQLIKDQFVNSQRFDIRQEVSYLEFPIELKYKFIDESPFAIEAIGGASTLFLKENSLTAESDNSGSIIFGSTKNLSKAYFSLNLGVGLSYRFAENFRINLEPMFKYHIKSNSTALQAYSEVVLAGIEYNFNSRNKKKVQKKQVD